MRRLVHAIHIKRGDFILDMGIVWSISTDFNGCEGSLIHFLCVQDPYDGVCCTRFVMDKEYTVVDGPEKDTFILRAEADLLSCASESLSTIKQLRGMK